MILSVLKWSTLISSLSWIFSCQSSQKDSVSSVNRDEFESFWDRLNELNMMKEVEVSSLINRSWCCCYERAQSSTETCVLWASLDSIKSNAHLFSVYIVFASHRSRSLALNSRLLDLLFVYLYLYDLL